MITKKDYENSISIENDKQEFINLALSNGFYLDDILSFMEHYENLKPMGVNLVNLQKFLE